MNTAFLSQIKSVNVVRKSVDARKSRGKASSEIDIRLVYNVQVELENTLLEQTIANKLGPAIAKIVCEHTPYRPEPCPELLQQGLSRPIVIGSGGSLFH